MIAHKHIGQQPGHNLGLMNDSPLIYRLDDPANPVSKIHHADFTNATAGRLLMSDSRLIGPFAANVPATALRQGRNFIQSESASKNEFTYSRVFRAAISDWTNVRATITDNAATAPDGTSAADTFVEDTSDNSHQLYQTITPDGSNQHTVSIYAKQAGRSWLNINVQPQGFVGNPIATYDIANGVVGATSGADDTGIEYAGDGWWRCWITVTSDAADATLVIFKLADSDGTAPSYQGDGSSGVYLWQAQIEIGAFPSSPIFTEATTETRDKDETKWDSDNVPAALRGKFTFKWIPNANHARAGDRSLGSFWSAGVSPRILLTYKATSDKIQVYRTTVGTAVQSAALTFDRHQVLTITLDPAAGSITVSGATTGNGIEVGTPWSTFEGDVYWGHDYTLSAHCNGLISEPYQQAA